MPLMDDDKHEDHGDVNDSKSIGEAMIRNMSGFNKEHYFRSQHVAAKYEPRWDILVDRHPDRSPSGNRYIEEKGTRILMELRGEGALVMTEKGLSIFTTEEILFHDNQLGKSR